MAGLKLSAWLDRKVHEINIIGLHKDGSKGLTESCKKSALLRGSIPCFLMSCFSSGSP